MASALRLAELTEAAQITHLAMDSLACDLAGITVIRSKGRTESLGAPDPTVRQADNLQRSLGEGPSAIAISDGDTVCAEDLATEPDWPAWGPQASGLGLASVLAVRLRRPEGTLGRLNLYAASRRHHTPGDLTAAQSFARHAAATLATVLTLTDLRAAVDGRTHIGQAQGILMERHHLNAEQAFSVLRRYSQDHNVKLRVVAQHLIDTNTLPSERPPAPAGDGTHRLHSGGS